MIGKLSQHAESPSNFHWTVVKRILCYINGTRNFGILYNGSSTPVAEGFSDAGLAGAETVISPLVVLCSYLQGSNKLEIHKADLYSNIYVRRQVYRNEYGD